MFKCETCSSSFTWRDNLLRHIKTHKGERISCNLCDSTFKYKSALTRHKKNLHIEHLSKVVSPINEMKTEMFNSNTLNPKVAKLNPRENDSIVLDELVRVKENIKRKYIALKNGETDIRQIITKTFKPIIDPLTKISNIRDNAVKRNSTTLDVIKEDIVDHKHDIGLPKVYDEDQSLIRYYDEEKDDSSEDLKYQYRINNWFASIDLDKTYGPKKQSNECITLGNKDVEFNQNSLLIEENTYPLTPGIVRLLFNKNPKSYTEQDLETYRSILVQTSAHLTLDSKIKCKGNKYKNIISKLFTSGDGLSKKLQKHNLIYWNDPNELVDRLRLLIASKAAGNTGVSNEIISIFEELLEAGLIKRIPNV